MDSCRVGERRDKEKPNAFTKPVSDGKGGREKKRKGKKRKEKKNKKRKEKKRRIKPEKRENPGKRKHTHVRNHARPHSCMFACKIIHRQRKKTNKQTKDEPETGVVVGALATEETAASMLRPLPRSSRADEGRDS